MQQGEGVKGGESEGMRTERGEGGGRWWVDGFVGEEETLWGGNDGAEGVKRKRTERKWGG